MLIRSISFSALIAAFVASSLSLFLPVRETLGIEFLAISVAMLTLSLAIFYVGRPLLHEPLPGRMLLLIVGSAVVVRVALLIGPCDSFPLSTDLYRYIWDGKVIASGVNPYLYPPNAPELQQYWQEEISTNINHPDLPTIYPPVAQLFFLLSYLVGFGTVWGFKLISLVAEVASIFLLDRWLVQSQVDRSHLLLWLFSPLVLIESVYSPHVDILAIPFLVGSLISLKQERIVAAAALLTGAVLVKFLCLLFVPFVIWHLAAKDRLRFSLAFGTVCAACYLPFFVSGGLSVFGSLPIYLAGWEYNGSIYLIIKQWTDSVTARLVCAALLLCWLAWTFVRTMELPMKLFLAFAGFAFLTTTLFPWYLIAIMPFVIRYASLPFLIFSGTVLLSYHGHDQIAWIPWQKISGMEFIIYGPPVLLLVYEAWRRQVKRVAV